MSYKHLQLTMLASKQHTASIKAKKDFWSSMQADYTATSESTEPSTISGGPFHWVSCPHYLGEIVIYAGLALLAGEELPLTLLILCWVVSSDPAK